MRHLPGPAARLCEVRGCICVESADAAIVILLECVSSRKSGSVTEVIEADVAMARVGTVCLTLVSWPDSAIAQAEGAWREGPRSGAEGALPALGSVSPPGLPPCSPCAHSASGSRGPDVTVCLPVPPGTQNCHMASCFFHQLGLS